MTGGCNVKEAIFAIIGTIVGFLLGWFKESVENKPKIEIGFRNGTFRYVKEKVDGYENFQLKR